jgi:signal transduction histidine kinase
MGTEYTCQARFCTAFQTRLLLPHLLPPTGGYDKEVVIAFPLPIRSKVKACTLVLGLILSGLAILSLLGLNDYRHLARSISRRAGELPLSAELTRTVSSLRFTLQQVQTLRDFPGRDPHHYTGLLREEFHINLLAVGESLERYRHQLSIASLDSDLLGDLKSEQTTIKKLKATLERINGMNRGEVWILDQLQIEMLNDELAELSRLAAILPGHLQQRMHTFASEVRIKYRTMIVCTWVIIFVATCFLVGLGIFFNRSLMRRFQVLIGGCRRVAHGDFDHRIELETGDEIAELAAAMNDMTTRFQEIRNHLDQQVQQRTREVVRGEQLASVGFLAAGVAHEINNPMASIAWCAESLESRLYDIMRTDDNKPDGEHNSEITVLRKYLRRIQDEAFRCKGITDRLLDFSRLGNRQKAPTELRELVSGVIDMVQHLGKYREKQVVFCCSSPVVAMVNSQEIKQVVLNLITNALDSLEPGGTVSVELTQDSEHLELSVVDTGCGMTQEVQQHLFDPFFTRRRDGQGTGLGLSITYRIITDHGGEVIGTSGGPGKGSRFQVTLPLTHKNVHHEENRKVG